jgi:PPK2 family polyphosphate:nucleotide phosphotransferase
VIKNRESFLKHYVVDDGRDFKLRKHDPSDTRSIKKETAKELLAAGISKLAGLQERLYAQDRWGILLVFQAMDAAGKDGAIKHVMSGINPQGCQVFSFKSPSPEDLDHDYLWRTSKSLPERGRIGIFNRSYYEEVLVVRVHPEFLARQKLPPELVTGKIWKERYEDINAFERYLSRNGYVIRKFFLNVSRNEQRRRFLERLTLDDKNWKFSMADAKEREYWDDYMSAYDAMIRHTATEHAPWVVVPADNKAFARVVVGAAVISALESIGLSFPKVDAAKKRELDAARAVLENEKGAGRDSGRKAGDEKQESERREGARR